MICLDDNTIVRWMDGVLPPDSAERAARHVGSCERCAAILTELVEQRTSSAARTRATPGSDGTSLDTNGVSAVAPEPDRAALGRYVISRRIGTGGMGVVFAAFDPSLRRNVALKVLRPDALGHDPHASERLLHEARTMARVAHPNVVVVHDVGESGGEVYVAMEHVAGETFGQWRAREPRSTRDVLRVLLEAGRGLSAAHQAGVTHRDFKPANVLVDASGRARVADFGLARAVDRAPAADDARVRDEAVTPGSHAAGTPAYMSPEQWLGNEVGPASDQFSFCAVAYEALFGVLPFHGPTPRERIAQILRGAPEPPASSGDAKWALPVLLRGLRPRPADRYASMDELLAAFDGAVERRITSLVRWLSLMTVVHWGVLLYVLLTYTPDTGQRPPVEPFGDSAGEIVAQIIFTAIQAAVLIWAGIGPLWAPLTAVALALRKRWAWHVAFGYALLSTVSILGTYFGFYGLWALTRPGVRSAFRARA